MFEEIGCFHSNAPTEMTAENSFSPAEPPPGITVSNSNNSNCSLEDLSEFHLSPQDCPLAASASAFVHINATPNCDHQFQTSIHQTLQDASYVPQTNNWDNGYQDFVNLSTNHTTPDLLSLLQLPRSSLPPFTNPNQSIQDLIMSRSSSVAAAYDPLFHLNFPLQPPHGTLLGVDNQIDQTNEGVNLMFAEENNDLNNGLTRKGRGSRKRKVFPTERERRVHFKDRFGDLKSLIPNPTKSDRASIVGEAIDYIKELLRTIDEFKLLVEKKRTVKHRNIEGDDVVEENFKAQNEGVEQCSINKNNNSLRCSWLKRKSKFTEVDVRIIDNEVTIKIVQKKKINCLLFVSKVLDQLQLDLHHVAGAQIGEHHSFLFNTKICEGSSVYASAIADKVMEVLERQYMEALSTNNNYQCYSSD